jgi:predicted small secreted protein
MKKRLLIILLVIVALVLAGLGLIIGTGGDSSSPRCSSRSTEWSSERGPTDVSPRSRAPAGPPADREPGGHAPLDGRLEQLAPVQRTIRKVLEPSRSPYLTADRAPKPGQTYQV